MLTEKDVRYVANLANLTLSADEMTRMAHDLAGILGQMDVLSKVDTTGIAPMSQVLFEDADETASLRADVEREPLGSDLAVANATITSGGYYKVPRVIEK